MKGRFCFFIALRYLLGRAKEGGRYLRGAVVGIAISLIPIMVTLIVADGMIRGIIDRYLELGTGHIQIFNFFESDKLDEIADDIRKMEGVRGVWLEQRGTGIISGKSGKAGAAIRAIDPSFWLDKGSDEYLVTRSGSAILESGRELLLGDSLAETLGVEVGGTVRLMTIRQGPTGQIPRVSPFTVRGIVSSGYHELDALWCIVSLEGGSRVLSADSSSSSLIVKIDDPYRGINEKMRALYPLLGTGFGVYSWKDLMRSQYSSYESTRQLLLFIMALIVVVAAINVSAATSMLVIERQRDIAVLKAAGTGVKGISGIFLWGSFLTGLLGAIIGITLGLGIGCSINQLLRFLEKLLSFFSGLFHGSAIKILDPGFYLETIPIIVDWKTVFAIGCFTVICSCLASWIPARRAGKLKPMELLRKYI
jgi:lipoprotein-releasing system permease protein